MYKRQVQGRAGDEDEPEGALALSVAERRALFENGTSLHEHAIFNFVLRRRMWGLRLNHKLNMIGLLREPSRATIRPVAAVPRGFTRNAIERMQ